MLKQEKRFDGRVAVIAGAGRGLCRSYALLLASKGARILVNDVGAAIRGDGTDPGAAEQVASEIRAAGGETIANTDTVATLHGGQAVIQNALDAWGMVDILIHNAGNVRARLTRSATRTSNPFWIFTSWVRSIWSGRRSPQCAPHTTAALY